MEVAADLSAAALAKMLPGRPLRAYPALLSVEADALAWARAGAPEGALVVADYQASPRGRAGLPWQVRAGASLAFSLVLRPSLPAEREGWLYTVATTGLADVAGPEATIEWPDQVYSGEARFGAVAVQTELGPAGLVWAVVSVLVEEAPPPRGELLRRVLDSIEGRAHSVPDELLAAHASRCRTIGRPVRARMIPLGPAGSRVTGRAARTLVDGALVIETESGRRLAVRPQNLGVLEDAPPAEAGGGPASGSSV